MKKKPQVNTNKDKQEITKRIDFEALIGLFEQTHSNMQKQAARSVDIALVVRNWLFGWYIVEYQQSGFDRAEYGKQLLKKLSRKLTEKIGKGFSVDNLELMRKFYVGYAEIQQTLPVKSLPLAISETLSRISSEEEKKKKAKKLNLSLMAKVRSKNDPRFKELGQRLERLKDKYEAGVLSSLDWLKELLDAARDMVRFENETHAEVIPDDKQALTEIFLELRNDTTPQIIANVVDDIDKIVRSTRFDGWQSTHTGQKEIQKVLRQTLFKYKLHKEQELFEKAYGYIREHY